MDIHGKGCGGRSWATAGHHVGNVECLKCCDGSENQCHDDGRLQQRECDFEELADFAGAIDIGCFISERGMV